MVNNSQEKQAFQILLVDDNPTNLQVLYKALEAEGHELLIAMNGAEALEIARSAQPTLILLDINMPGLDGFETCEQLKADPLTADSAIIFLSARDSVDDKVRGLEIGGVDYISKPFQFQEVIARVQTQIGLRQARLDAETESAKADRLLHSILPDSIAERLKRNERNPVDEIESATIIFCDLSNFTPYASGQKAAAIVRDLDSVFSRLDLLTERFCLEKIKTIGDCYMAAAGVPDPLKNHPTAAVDFALTVIDEWSAVQEDIQQDLGVRIGIHSGPVVAGVIGEDKYAYDVWGDTVNIASRLEETGEAGKIHLSEHTKNALNASDYCFNKRGPITLRGIGEVETYFVTRTP